MRSILRRLSIQTHQTLISSLSKLRTNPRGTKTGASRPAFYVLALGVLALSVLFVSIGETATPPGGTLTVANDETNPLTYTAGPYFVANATAQANGTPICNAATQCDDFMLTVNVSAAVAAVKNVKIQIQWPISTADFDLYVLDASSNVVAQSASSADPETAFITAVPSSPTTYTVRVAPFAPAGQSFTGRISLVPKPVPAPPGAGPAPRYKDYFSPPGGGDSAGEPSIGVDWNPNVAALKHGTVNTGGVAFFTANAAELRTNFDDCSSPAKDSWEDVTSPQTSAGGLDPIGFVDHYGVSPTPGRVFQSQLAAAAGSITAYSDDDGNTWTASQGAGQPAGVDHQTLGGGPYSSMGPGGVVPPHPTYPNAVYYASQDAATAFCARSDNGGLSFGPGVAVYNLTQCGGLHGHIKVAPDGTVYIPNRGCSVGTGAQGVAVSTDNGLTWAVRTVPGSTSSDGDPSLGIATDGTIYLGFQNGDGRPHLAVSHDRGLTWADQDVSGQAAIQNCVFPEVVAGDPMRAAFGFLGTTTPGNYQDANFHGVWYFFIVTTYDGGATFLTVNGTPNDPVQVGSICTGGTTCGSDRNLLDFNDITMDKEGRVLVGFADGCVAPGCTETSPSAASRSAKATIIRQSGGRRLLAAFDPVEPAVPPAPRLISATKDAAGVVTVKWDEPDDAGSPLTNYKVYRGTSSGGETLLATISAASPKYIDSSGIPTTQYFYRVTAVNAQGEGTFCGEVATTTAPPVEDPCRLPFKTIVDDPPGDQTGAPGNAGLDITKVSMGEPFMNSCSNTLVFRMKVGDLTVLPQQARWTIFFSRTDGGGMSTEYFVSMNTDSTGNPTGVTFNYGHTSIGSGGIRTLTTDGPADTGSTYSTDGIIIILISNSKLTFNLHPPPPTLPPPGAGEQFTNVNAITQQTIGVLLATLDSTGSNSYTLVGTRFCQDNTPPIASLSAMPTMGDPPLVVSFDASGSTDPDMCDTVVIYTFNFDDGNSLITPSSHIMHTYTSPGQYRATVRVTDSRGLLSANTASVNIEVENCLSASTVSSTGMCFTGDANSGTVDVTAESGCAWTASSNATWITITGGATGSGNGTVSYSIAENQTSTRRQGSIMIAGHMFTALQGIKFLDVPMSNQFYTDIGKISAKGVTLGCDIQLFCPTRSVTRGEMAAFIVRALGVFNPPPPASQRFLDVPPSHQFYAFIEELARRNITLGCGDGNFCPEAPVLREQMAAFIVRALGEFNPPMPGSQRFQDVPPSNQFYAFIDRIAALGIANGCQVTPLLYCPSDPVPREQMAAFLNRAFGCP